MSKVTVVGSGNVGTAVAGVAQKAGAEIQIVGRNQEHAAALAEKVGGTAADGDAPLTGDVVVLAVPYAALADLADHYGPELDGKVVVDVTNPVDFTTFDSLLVPADSSAAAELAERLPKARVVKAFNTAFAGPVATGRTGELQTTILVAGDDDAAKKEVLDLVAAAGLSAVDAGSLKRAREMEAMAFLAMTLAASGKISWTGGFGLIR